MIARIARGHLRHPELNRYLIGLSVVFWGLIFICWMIYPAENRYSIMTHTFSFLGSWEAKHNPQGWWLFTLALIVWGVGTVPLVAYTHHRFAAHYPRLAWPGTFFLLCGCLGMVLVGIFPDVAGDVIPGWRWTKVHEKVAVVAFAGFFLGLMWNALLLAWDAAAARWLGHRSHFNHGRLAVPSVTFAAIVAVAVYHLITWEFLYARMRADAAAGGYTIGSSWSEALNTKYSFPLWENVLIYSLYAFLMVFVVLLPRHPAPAPGVSAGEKA